MPIRPVMLLAHNWGSEAELDLNRPGENRGSRYWRNLRLLLRTCDICVCNCFATNAYPGLLKSSRNTGEFPGASDEQFLTACRRFLAEQIRVVRPALIVTLGRYVPRVLAPLSPDLRGWMRANAFKVLNDDNAFIPRARFPDACHTATVVALTHPSCRQGNVRYRKYHGCKGEDAEQKMLKDAWRVAQKPV
jgi:uracil-DNA glycosylase